MSHLSPSKKNLTYYFLKELSVSGEDIKLKWPHSVYWILTRKMPSRLTQHLGPLSYNHECWKPSQISSRWLRSEDHNVLQKHFQNPLLSTDNWKRFKAGHSSSELDPQHSEGLDSEAEWKLPHKLHWFHERQIKSLSLCTLYDFKYSHVTRWVKHKETDGYYIHATKCFRNQAGQNIFGRKRWEVQLPSESSRPPSMFWACSREQWAW